MSDASTNSQRSVPTPTCAADGDTKQKSTAKTDRDSFGRYKDHLPFEMDNGTSCGKSTKCHQGYGRPLLVIGNFFPNHFCRLAAAIDRAVSVADRPLAGLHPHQTAMQRTARPLLLCHPVACSLLILLRHACLSSIPVASALCRVSA